MTRQEANAYVCIIVETVAESAHGVPSGHLYAGLMHAGITLDDYQLLLGLAQKVGLVEVEPSHLVTITAKGRETAKKITAARAGGTTKAEG